MDVGSLTSSRDKDEAAPQANIAEEQIGAKANLDKADAEIAKLLRHCFNSNQVGIHDLECLVSAEDITVQAQGRFKNCRNEYSSQEG